MQKIPTIFKRDYIDTYKVFNSINPECAWVFDNQGKTYRKWQGMAAMIQDGQYYKRCVIKKNQLIPASFISCAIDNQSEKIFGWLPVNFDLSHDQYYISAFNPILPDGTYELIGPKIHGNKENFTEHTLVSHTSWELDLNRTYKNIKDFLFSHDYEGLVFHHPDGRMAKIKKKDFNK